MAALLHNTLP